MLFSGFTAAAHSTHVQNQHIIHIEHAAQTIHLVRRAPAYIAFSDHVSAEKALEIIAIESEVKEYSFEISNFDGCVNSFLASPLFASSGATALHYIKNALIYSRFYAKKSLYQPISVWYGVFRI